MDRARARSPVRGLGGRRPRRDPVHHPRRGHGLGTRRRGQLGCHRADDRRIPASPFASARPIRAEGWITRSRRRIVDTAGRIVEAATGDELATATGVYVAADPARKQDLRERYGFRRVEAPKTRLPDDHRDRGPSDGSERGDRPRGGLRRRTPRAGRGPRGLARRARERSGRLRAALSRGLAISPTPSTSPASNGSRRGSGRSYGVRWPLMAAVQRGFRNATQRDRATPLLFVADRLFREASSRPAGSPSVSSSARSSPRPSAPGSSSGARRARRATGSRSIRSPIHTARASSPSRTAGPSSSSSSTARRAGSAASSGRRSRR